MTTSTWYVWVFSLSVYWIVYEHDWEKLHIDHFWDLKGEQWSPMRLSQHQPLSPTAVISPATLTQSLTALFNRNFLNLQAKVTPLKKLKETVLRCCFTKWLRNLAVSCITSSPTSKISNASLALIRKEIQWTPPKYNPSSRKVCFL